MDNVLTVKEAAAFLHCSERQIYRLLREHKLSGTFYRIGKRIFFRAESLENWINKGGTLQFEVA